MFTPKKENGIYAHKVVKINGWKVYIIKIPSVFGAFAGWGFTIPQLLMEGGGYSTPEMVIKTVEMFLSTPGNPVIFVLTILLTLIALFA